LKSVIWANWLNPWWEIHTLLVLRDQHIGAVAMF
jgi:hypothetical protein